MEENKERNPVPYFVHEEILARQERNTKRLFILCIIIFVALIGTNAGWILYESQFEDIVMSQEASTEGGDGDVTVNGSALGDVNYYGEGETDDQGSEEEDWSGDGVQNMP